MRAKEIRGNYLTEGERQTRRISQRLRVEPGENPGNDYQRKRCKMLRHVDIDGFHQPLPRDPLGTGTAQVGTGSATPATTQLRKTPHPPEYAPTSE